MIAAYVCMYLEVEVSICFEISHLVVMSLIHGMELKRQTFGGSAYDFLKLF